MFLFDGDQISERCGVGDGLHSARMLARLAARRSFEQRRLPVQFRFVDRSEGDTVPAKKIFGLDSGKIQHLRNLVQSECLVAVAFEGDCLQGAARHIAAGGGKPLRDLVGDVQGNFHASSLARERDGGRLQADSIACAPQAGG